MKAKVLFICTQNKLRSPTAQRIFQDHPYWDVRSAGVGDTAATPLNAELMEWADLIFVFEKAQRNKVHKKFKELYETKRIVCLYIPDEYDFMQSELIELIKSKTSRYLEERLPE